MIDKTRKECIGCNTCKNNCDFLTKYDINLKQLTYRNDLKNSCFLCGRCESVCPKKLSGNEIIHQMREEEKGSLKTKILKENYPFKNYPKKDTDTVIFLGCNYPGFYPKTSKKLIEIAEGMGIDFVIDCCQKPVYENGYEVDFKNIEKRFKKRKIKNIIYACPNCYHFLKDKIDINSMSIYEFLAKNGIGKKIQESANVFFPCSDRYNRQIFKIIEKNFLLNPRTDAFEDINCCGLGGGARKFEKDIVDDIGKKIRKKEIENVYTYCSSCSGAFKNHELKNVKNILSEILGTDEDVSDDYAKNIIYFKLKKHR